MSAYTLTQETLTQDSCHLFAADWVELIRGTDEGVSLHRGGGGGGGGGSASVDHVS